MLASHLEITFNWSQDISNHKYLFTKPLIDSTVTKVSEDPGIGQSKDNHAPIYTVVRTVPKSQPFGSQLLDWHMLYCPQLRIWVLCNPMSSDSTGNPTFLLYLSPSLGLSRMRLHNIFSGTASQLKKLSCPFPFPCATCSKRGKKKYFLLRSLLWYSLQHSPTKSCCVYKTEGAANSSVSERLRKETSCVPETAEEDM